MSKSYDEQYKEFDQTVADLMAPDPMDPCYDPSPSIWNGDFDEFADVGVDNMDFDFSEELARIDYFVPEKVAAKVLERWDDLDKYTDEELSLSELGRRVRKYGLSKYRNK